MVASPTRTDVDVPVRGLAVRGAVGWAAQHALAQAFVQRGVRNGDVSSRLVGDPAARVDPYPLHAALRAEGELVRGRLSLMSASHAVVKEVLRSPAFGVRRDAGALPGPVQAVLRWSGAGAPPHPVEPPAMLAVDPPEHTRYRRLVSSVFTPRAISRLRDRVETVADELLDRMAAAERPVDLVDAYAARLPVSVISDILGVPADEYDLVLDFGNRLLPCLDFGIGYREFRTARSGLADFDAWIGRHLERLRRAPGDDLLSQLVTVGEDGDQLTERELRATARLLLVAGFETTQNLLSSGTELLLRHPDQLALLRADDALWGGAVDELLRLESPVQLTSRTALTATTLAGVDLPENERVTVFIGGANRDPAVFDDPDRLDVTRANAAEHLALGAGRHFCLGAALARMEGEVGLRSLLTRFPDLSLAAPGRRSTSRILRGWHTLPVTPGTPA